MASITIAQLKKILDEKPELMVIDIRTPWETKEGRIPKAISMDVSDKDFITKVLALPKDKPYCFYCASGGRTSMVIPFLEENGFRDVVDLDGGIGSWVLGGNELEH